jgi:hypothetical protein
MRRGSLSILHDGVHTLMCTTQRYSLSTNLLAWPESRSHVMTQTSVRGACACAYCMGSPFNCQSSHSRQKQSVLMDWLQSPNINPAGSYLREVEGNADIADRISWFHDAFRDGLYPSL